MAVTIEYVDTSKKETASRELCRGEINGARPVHHKVVAGDEMAFAAGVGYYHILILIEGSAVRTLCAGVSTTKPCRRPIAN